MLNAIKTAILTIIMSFISGVLLDYYKNIAPKILCCIKKNAPVKLNHKVIKVYSLIVRNTSNKTIHHLTINVHGFARCDKLKISDEKITNGLKYDITSENNIYNVNIPFLSQNDEFTAKVLLQSEEKTNKKPIVNLRSPENFKEVNSRKARNNKLDFLSNRILNNKKIIVSVISVLLIIYVGIIGGEYFVKAEAKVNNGENKAKPSIETNVNEASKDTSSKQNSSNEKSSASKAKDENEKINAKSSSSTSSNDGTQKKASSNSSTNNNDKTNAQNAKEKNNEEQNSEAPESDGTEKTIDSPEGIGPSNDPKRFKNSIAPAQSGESPAMKKSESSNGNSSNGSTKGPDVGEESQNN